MSEKKEYSVTFEKQLTKKMIFGDRTGFEPDFFFFLFFFKF